MEDRHWPKALTSLKYFCEQMPELTLCAAGSLLGVYLADESFPVGKVTLLDLFPMSFEEFLEALEKQSLVELLRSHVFHHPLPQAAHDRLWDLWKLYLIVGGLPEAVACYRNKMDDQYKAVKDVREVQHNLLETYMADIAKHSGKINALHIERLWRNVTHQLARSQNGSAPKFRFKTYKGYVAENFLAQELRSSGISALYCWSGRTAEVEFLLESASGIIPVEVKAGNITQSKSLRVYEERYKPQKSIVLSARNIESRGPRLHVPLYLAGILRKYAASNGLGSSDSANQSL